MSSEEVIIKIENLSKLFYKQKQRTFKELLPAVLTGKKTRESFWALKNINLEVKKGESVGITGPNGSGKSTLLKLIAKVCTPTKGTIQINGSVAPLIELGAGFHPELSGRENIYLNGIILGMKRSDIKKYDYLEFGNHTRSHPIMTCLNHQEQFEEIVSTHRYLKGAGVEPVGLAVPFFPYNNDTLDICRQIGYNLVLTFKNQSNPVHSDAKKDICILYRRMAPEDLKQLAQII